ncbi:MAG: hypothetical protein KAG56_05665 [Sulfurovaceae bacterium]|nr:hypothetical protein [Sulfurovaceae bacterium]
MKVNKIGTVAMILLIGTTSVVFGDTNNTTTTDKNIAVENRVAVEKNVKSNSVTEAEIMKALGGITTIQVMKSATPKIVSESEAMVLNSDKPKVIKKRKVKRVKRKIRRNRRVQQATAMDDLPMAKSYPMSYDVSKITE